MPSFILRNIDPQLWEQFKKRASAEGHPLRWTVLELIRRYILDGFK